MIPAIGAENSTPTSSDSSGSQSTVFRAPVPTTVATPSPSVRIESPSERVIEDSIEIKPGIPAYKEVVGVPLSADYFGLKKVYGKVSQVDRDHLEKVDLYLQRKYAQNVIAGDYDSATAALKSLEESLNLEPHMSPYHRLDKIADYLGVVPTGPADNEPRSESKLRPEPSPLKETVKQLKQEKSQSVAEIESLKRELAARERKIKALERKSTPISVATTPQRSEQEKRETLWRLLKFNGQT